MKSLIFLTLLIISFAECFGQEVAARKAKHFERLQVESRIPELKLSLLYLAAATEDGNKLPVLFIHGASFPSALAFGFRMNNYSWMDDLSREGYSVYALDHLGYGASDRYHKMLEGDSLGAPLGTGKEVALDIEKTVSFILKQTGQTKLHLIGHSWGATVSGYYATLHPEQIEKLVLFAPFVARDDSITWNSPDYPYLELTPEKRLQQFYAQLQEGNDSVLEDEVVAQWGGAWLASDKDAAIENREFVRYPAGWKKDLYDCWTGHCIFEPEKLLVSTLVIRGEWDEALNWNDAEKLFQNLKSVPSKRYVVIDKSTHVAHLEKSRSQLYDQVKLFLSETNPIKGE